MEGDRNGVRLTRSVDAQVGDRFDVAVLERREVDRRELDHGSDGGPLRDGLGFDRVLQRLGERGIEQGSEVDVVEPSPSFDRARADRSLPGRLVGQQEGPREEGQSARDHQRARLQEPTASVENRAEDVLLERFGADRLRDEDVRELGQFDVERPPAHDGDLIAHTVDGEHLLRDVGDVRRLDGVDVTGAGSRGGDCEHAVAGADVDDHVAGPHPGGDRSEVVVRPAVVVEHAGLFRRVGPPGRRRRIASDGDEPVGVE